MSDPAPRRRLRFSLITLLVAVNVAGVLVWANVSERDISTVDFPHLIYDERIDGPTVTNFPGFEIVIFKVCRGWPKIALLGQSRRSRDRRSVPSTGATDA